MMDKNSHIVLLTHTDMDGYGSEIVLKSAGIEPTIVHLENHEVDSYIDTYVTDLLKGNKEMPDYLFITDIAPSEKVAKKVDELYQTNKVRIHLFDHHATALGLNFYNWAIVCPDYYGLKPCGTSLFYQLIKSEVDIPKKVENLLDRLVEEIRLYDTWEWEKANHRSAKELNDLFYLIGPKAFVESQVEKIQNNIQSLFSDEEELLLSVEKKRINQYLESKNKEMIIIDDFFTDGEGNPLVAGVVQADMYTSELGHYLCDNNPEIDFALLLKFTNNKASLRATKEEVNVIPIVKRYEGGGHPHAAGCKITPMGAEFMNRVFAIMSKK